VSNVVPLVADFAPGPHRISMMVPQKQPQLWSPINPTGSSQDGRPEDVSTIQRNSVASAGVVGFTDTDNPVMHGKLRPSLFKLIPRF
jgi:hypothetical protein